MSSRTIILDEDQYAYYQRVAFRDSEVLRELREETAALPEAGMQISPEQGALMALLAETVGARRTVEVGCFTGYSALMVASVLPADGKLVTMDMSDEWTAIGRKYWEKAGVAERIDLRLGPALDTLDALIAEDGPGAYDFAFVDADKKQYDAYYEACLTLLRPGGLVLLDNVLWSGAVADPADTRNNTKALRAINEKIAADERVSMVMVPIGDGLTVARKR